MTRHPTRTTRLLEVPVSASLLAPSVRARARAGGGAERGDVPGWVMITVMTAGLVMLIWAAAGPALETLLTTAISSVTNPG
jgi:hypothetical protein